MANRFPAELCRAGQKQAARRVDATPGIVVNPAGQLPGDALNSHVIAVSAHCRPCEGGGIRVFWMPASAGMTVIRSSPESALHNHPIVVPAHAGTQEYQGPWMPASAGVTVIRSSPKSALPNHPIVVPAHAGTQEYQGPLDARFRGHDGDSE